LLEISTWRSLREVSAEELARERDLGASSSPKSFQGERVAIRPLDRDGRYGVFFASHRIATIDLTDGKTVSHVSEHVSAMSPG